MATTTVTIISPYEDGRGRWTELHRAAGQHGSVKEPHIPMASALCDDFIEYIKRVRNFASPTVRTYKYIASNFCKALGDRVITDITLEEIDLFIADFSEKRGYKPSSANTVRCVLRSFFLYADKYRGIRLRFDYAAIKQVKAPRSSVVICSPDEVTRMIKGLETYQDKVMMLTMFSCGLRIGELVALCVEDFHGTSLTVRGKGGKVRSVPLDEKMSTILTKFIRDNNLLTGSLFRHQVAKVTNPYGACYSVGGLRKRWQRKLEPLGLYKKPHALRHGVATHLMMAGMDIRTLQTFLGHSHIATTMLYTHVSDRHLEESYKRHFGKIGITANIIDS